MIVTVIKGLLFSSLLLYAAYTDIKKREIEDCAWVLILIISMIGTGGSFMGWSFALQTARQCILGGVLTALPFFIPALFNSSSIGGGDIKLMFACGAMLGVWGGVLQIIIGLSLATIYGLFVLITKGGKAYKQKQIPLAPFLCVGGILSFIISNIGGI